MHTSVITSGQQSVTFTSPLVVAVARCMSGTTAECIQTETPGRRGRPSASHRADSKPPLPRRRLLPTWRYCNPAKRSTTEQRHQRSHRPGALHPGYQHERADGLDACCYQAGYGRNTRSCREARKVSQNRTYGRWRDRNGHVLNLGLYPDGAPCPGWGHTARRHLRCRCARHTAGDYRLSVPLGQLATNRREITAWSAPVLPRAARRLRG